MVIIIQDNEHVKQIKKTQLNLFNTYISYKIQQKNNNSYSPDENGKKYLVIMACHCDTELKLNTIRTNLHFFAFENTHKILINTSGLPYGEKVADICSRHDNTKYCEIPNSGYYDFGKWLYVLTKNVNIDEYDYIVLTNDSFIIKSSINHFLNLTYKHNVELYGYNDSTQTRYHYQSYLFSLRKDAVQKFITNISNRHLIVNNLSDVINNFEIKMTDWFSTKKSFLKIGNFALNRNHNIFFTNDLLYSPLRKTGLLPFIKIKRIT